MIQFNYYGTIFFAKFVDNFTACFMGFTVEGRGLMEGGAQG